ncbi:MAG: hypothetical protein RIC15_08290 [Vicingaceae bacterium]
MRISATYGVFIGILGILSCAGESQDQSEESKEIQSQETAVDAAVAPNIDTIISEAIFLSVGSPDEVLREIQGSMNSSEQMNAYIGVDQVNDVMISHVHHQGQRHLIFDKATSILPLKLIYRNQDVIEPPFRVSIRHRVKDFPTWKWLYDGDQKSRENAGMVLVEMGLVGEDANDVFLIVAIPDVAKAREMMEKPNLKKKMAQGGVIGDPEISFWRPLTSDQ